LIVTQEVKIQTDDPLPIILEPASKYRSVLRLSGLGGADGNRHWLCGFGGCNNVAFTVKNSARLDHQAVGVNFARSDSFGVNLHSSFREDYSVEAARNHHVVALDLTLYARFLA
jgi:hypothetical protein